ncbi:MAG TPA: endonuclease [Kiritimatiellia bacterium]|nr:endonuclease [Kiritimatiellia bacterium]
MPRSLRAWIPALCAAAWLAARTAAQAAGFETFDNFPETGSTYTNGSFLGQDGSTWTYVQCRGNKIIGAPRTPGLNKGTNLAYVASGTITGGCGTLSFDWMQLFTATVGVDVVVNGTVRHTIVGGPQNATNHAVDLPINQAGNFTLMLRQNNKDAGQVAVDNLAWTSYGGTAPEPPALLFAPETNFVRTAYSNLIQLTVTATEPNVDVVRLWAAGLPAGATFNAATGTAPLMAAFSWRPTSVQTGTHAVVFYAGDKDGTNSRTFSIEITPIYPYYHYAMGLTGAVLKAKLHEIISTGTRELNDDQENEAMKVLHTHPDNPSNVYYLYNVTSSVPKTLYNANNGWNKEHCWPESRGLGSDGPDQVDVHNLFAEDKGVNALRGNLYYDESDPADPGYRAPATNAAPETSMDSNSFEPPPASKGNVARGAFYMAVRYDGGEDKTTALWFSDNPAHTNSMGKLATLLLWHAMDPPDALESNKNELIYADWQYNRNPFIDHPEWVEQIWGTDSDGDGVTDTHEIIAGTATNDRNSVFEATLTPTEIVCGSLSSGSVWRLYEGQYRSNDLVWRAVAETNRLQSGTLRFPVAPTGAATFYHLRALRP